MQQGPFLPSARPPLLFLFAPLFLLSFSAYDGHVSASARRASTRSRALLAEEYRAVRAFSCFFLPFLFSLCLRVEEEDPARRRARKGCFSARKAAYFGVGSRGDGSGRPSGTGIPSTPSPLPSLQGGRPRWGASRDRLSRLVDRTAPRSRRGACPSLHVSGGREK